MARPRKIAHEKFAEFAASGLSLSEAYRRTTGQTKNADVKGTQWHGYAGIKERIAELKAQNAQRAQMTREELMAFYAAVIRTPANQVPAGSPVIQAYEQDGEGRVKLRLCDKVQAGAALARMCGYNEPEQLRLSSGNSLTNYLLELRSQSLFGGPVLSLEQPALPVRNEENGEEHRSANG
jgi:Terminase small subunit